MAILLAKGNAMKSRGSILGLLAIAVAASGCSSVSGLLDDGPAPQTMAAAPADLSMPPDLRLPPPGSAPPPAPAYQETQAVASAPAASVATPAVPSTGVRKPEDAAYEKYGIVIYNPDGTRRPDAVLREELRKATVAEKQKANPNYGTVFNIGNIFKDE
ncbi:MAG: hypothetical protein ACRCVZ_13385 [Aestuariivirga sp.]